MTKPTAVPPTFELRTRHGRCASGLPVRFGPTATCSGDSSPVPIRLVNQVESGTSSSAFTSAARRGGRICIQRSIRLYRRPSK